MIDPFPECWQFNVSERGLLFRGLDGRMRYVYPLTGICSSICLLNSSA